MISISKQELIFEAKTKGYRPEILEKVYRLLDLIEQFMALPYLNTRLALKGGTAINLFCSDQLPRLSVDLDFNYIGSIERNTMLQEKQQIEEIILDICQRQKYNLHRNPRAHAGGKMVLIYDSLLGNKGRLEIDLNYIFRIPLWDIVWRNSPQWPKVTKMAILDLHELAAGKLHALLGREASRDLFDSHQLLTKWPLDLHKLRLAFTVYSAMERDHWQQISLNKINFTVQDIRNKLLPVLKDNYVPGTSGKIIETWAKRIVEECKDHLSAILPFKEHEIEFLERLQQYGEIRPDLISTDEVFCQRVRHHPSLHWRIQQR